MGLRLRFFVLRPRFENAALEPFFCSASSIHHLKSLKNLEFYEMPTEFVLSLQPDEGPDFGKVKHIPSVTFWYRTHGEYYESYELGDSELLKRLQR